MWGLVWRLCVPEAAETLGEVKIRPNEAARRIAWPPELKRAKATQSELRDLWEGCMRTKLLLELYCGQSAGKRAGRRLRALGNDGGKESLLFWPSKLHKVLKNAKGRKNAITMAKMEWKMKTK